jgi:hypothetical protein
MTGGQLYSFHCISFCVYAVRRENLKSHFTRLICAKSWKAAIVILAVRTSHLT